MRYRITLLALACMALQLVSAQYKYDNVSYQTVYIEDLCAQLKKYPNHIILDVRSKGENSDTSSSANYNIGHMKGAININISEISARWRELNATKDQPIFVYCSHSQRSRRVSKILSDSGFTHIINVNGAMTEFNLLKNVSVPCVNDLYETANTFKILSPAETAKLISTNKDVFILDVRTDSAFRGISLEERDNAYGKLKGSVNIPAESFTPATFDKIPIPQMRDRPILVIDDQGNQSARTAKLLTTQGYTNVNLAFNGLDMWMEAGKKEVPQRENIWIHPHSYSFINSEEFGEKMSTHPDALILDVRTVAEFTNQEKQLTYKNRGHIDGAVNIPLSELLGRLNEINNYKGREIIVYSFNNTPESFTAAKFLADKGFSKVTVLTGGLWNIRWKAANIKGLTGLMKWVVDVPSDNL